MRKGEWSRIKGAQWRTLRFSAPLSYDDPHGQHIQVFCREVRPISGSKERPYLLYLQGGPGFAAPRVAELSGWMRAALKHFNLLLLDQRGTGQSSRIELTTLSEDTVANSVAYLSNFRAPEIVSDAERLRELLLGPGRQFWLWGQSFGGFCCFTYLSMFPEALAGVMVTGGVPPIGVEAVDVYSAIYPTLINRNQILFESYPAFEASVNRVFEKVESNSYLLPCGDPVTVNRLKALGILLGQADGAGRLFHLIEDLDDDLLSGGPSFSSLSQIERVCTFSTNPIYALLHESIYAEGAATQWGASRARARIFSSGGDHFSSFFDGEMVFQSTFQDRLQLRPVAQLADGLAQKSDWSPLYDQGRLANNEVPVACLVYDDDMYVDRGLSLQTLKRVKNARYWSTNEFEHDGLRREGKKIFERLFGMLEGIY